MLSTTFFLTMSIADPISWQLENYNGWNLPFAKTVEITGRKGGLDPYVEREFSHQLATNTYKLEVDPSALFSFIFVSNTTFTDYNEKDVMTMNYTFLGSAEMMSYTGVWVDTNITVF